MSLLLRYYEPSAGKITINGRLIDEYNITQLRKNIGVVSQEPVCLFSFFYVLILQFNVELGSFRYNHL